MSGIVLLDINALRVFQDPQRRTRLLGSLRAAHLDLWLTGLNVLEAAASENREARSARLRLLGELAGGYYILPTPRELLARVGASLVAGESGFALEETELEWVVRNPERVTENQSARARTLLANNEAVWESAHRRAREHVRERLRLAGERDPWGNVANFLERQWMRVEMLSPLIALLWQGMRLPGEAPCASLLQQPTWQLYHEGIGATVYEACVPGQRAQPAHMADVAQLAYLGGAEQRILVTNDKGLLRVATLVLERRHRLARVMTPNDLLAAAGG